MGFKHTVQSLSPVAWPGLFGQDSGQPKSAGGRARAFDPAGAQTPEEALTYIRQLSKAGRTDELVGLLRRSPVFREAWQTLQQFSSTNSDAAGGPAAAAIPTPDRSGLPVPSPGAGCQGRFPSPGPDPVAPQVSATPGFSGKIPASQTFPVQAPRPTRPLNAALQVYETQARYFAQEKANSPRISLRV
jgi:hypothetical protein